MPAPVLVSRIVHVTRWPASTVWVRGDLRICRVGASTLRLTLCEAVYGPPSVQVG